MKIAFCLHGISSGKNFKNGGLPVTFENEASLFKEHIIDKYNTDCFYHTWESDATESLKELYKPKNHLVEKAKIFFKPKLFDYLKHFLNKFRGIDELQRKNNIYSRWYSFNKSIELVLNYQKENNIKYDFIFITRFDMSLFKDVKFESLNNSNFYCGDWYTFYNQKNQQIDEKLLYNNLNKASKIVEGYPYNEHGISDFWFCSSPKTMEDFAQIFYKLNKLIENVGKSNHLIALEQLKLINKVDKLEKILEFGKDYYLSRWI